MALPNGNTSGPKTPLYTAPAYQAGESGPLIGKIFKGFGEATLAANKTYKKAVAGDTQRKANEQALQEQPDEEHSTEGAPSNYTGAHTASPRLPSNKSQYIGSESSSLYGGNHNLSAEQYSTPSAQLALKDASRIKPI